MIESRTVIEVKNNVVHWQDIKTALCDKLGLKHLRNGEGGPGFDFWLYFTDRCTDYVPNGISEGGVCLAEDIECIETDGFTWPNEHDKDALPILKALAELLPENLVEEGFYVDYC